MDHCQLRPLGSVARARFLSHRLTRVLLRRVAGACASVLVLLAPGLAACDVLPNAPDAGRSVDEAPVESRAAVDLINQHRLGEGCGPLQWHARSALIAEEYSRLMNDRGFFGHVDPSGGTLKYRLDQAGVVGYRFAAETIAAGQWTATKVVGDWILSAEHRAILGDCRYTHAGVGFYSGDGPYGVYWTAVFLAVQ